MFYRIVQFYRAFFPNVKSSEIKWVQENIPPETFALFLKQSPSEQRHSIDVAQSIIKCKNQLVDSDYRTLQTAAIIHDCGKSLVRLRLWHRVFIVLMQKAPGTLWLQIEQSSTIFALPLKVATQHPLWGESLAQQAGIKPEVCLLIRTHHSPNTDLGRILEQADNAH